MTNSTLSATNVNLPGRGIKLLDSLHEHANLVVLIFFLVLFFGIPIVFIKGEPSYETVATIHVSPYHKKTLHDDSELELQSNTQYLQFISQQARTINRYDIIELALQRLEEAGINYWTLEGESNRKAIERLQKSLNINHVRNTYLVQVRLISTESEGIDVILNAVIEAYLERAKEELFYASDERIENLKQREKELLDHISALTTERADISRNLGVTAFNPDEVNPFDRRMRTLQEEYQLARTTSIKAQARLEAYLLSGDTDTEMRSVQETLLSDPGLNSLRGNLNQRRAELLTATSGLGTQHPAYLDAQDELQKIDEEISNKENKLSNSLKHGIEKRLRNSAVQAQQIEAKLDQMLQELILQSTTYTVQVNQAVALTNHLNLFWKELDRVRDRLNFFEIESTSPGMTHLVTPALPPLYPTGTSKKKLLLLIIIAALILSLTVPITIDLLDGRVRTVNDVHRTLGFPPLSWILDGVDPDQLSFAEDQLRRLASAMVRDGTRNGSRTFVITSVRPGGGTTWIARSLTRTLNSLGFPTLLIEGNAYHPDPIYGQGSGLISVLESGFDPQHINTKEPNIPCIPVGESKDHRVLLNLQNLRTALNSIPEDYRFVIVDAPPLLASSDAELVAGAGDAVLLVVEAGSIMRGELSRAGRLLNSIDPPVVGALVNRIKPFHGSGYITALVKEHRSGRKVEPESPVHTMRSTLSKLILAPFAMLRDLLFIRALRPRRRSASKTDQTQEEP